MHQSRPANRRRVTCSIQQPLTGAGVATQTRRIGRTSHALRVLPNGPAPCATCPRALPAHGNAIRIAAGGGKVGVQHEHSVVLASPFEQHGRDALRVDGRIPPGYGGAAPASSGFDDGSNAQGRVPQLRCPPLHRCRDLLGGIATSSRPAQTASTPAARAGRPPIRTADGRLGVNPPRRQHLPLQRKR